jgi:hypothetical protein
MNATETKDMAAYRYAVAQQGFEGTYADWQALSKAERMEYELGAAGIPTERGQDDRNQKSF